MSLSLARLSLLVPDYDLAIAWCAGALGFVVVEDLPLGEGRRWVVVGPPHGAGAQIVLAKAVDHIQRAAVGLQGGGRVWLFLNTGDFAAEHARMQAAGVRFLEAPRTEAYGTVAVFEDPWGNRWDLIEPSRRV